MKAQVLHSVSDIVYEDVDMPELQEGWVLVNVKAAGVCGSDIPRIYKTGAHRHPLIPGHEFAGQVVDVKEDFNKSWINKRVGVFPLIPCGECECCQNKQYEMCKNYNYLGSRCNGGFAEYVAVPEWNLIELPDKVSYKQAAMLEPMSVAVHAMRQFNIQKKDSVCVIGLGTIGLLLVMFLKEAGINNISVICNKEAQKEYAVKLGIPENNIIMSDYYIKEKCFDYVFECVGRNETVEMSIELAAPAGHIVFVGNPYSDMKLSKDIYWKILRSQIKISGTWNSSYTGSGDDDWHYVLDRLNRATIHPETFITHEYSLEDIQKGMEIMRDKTEDYVKVMSVL